MKQSVNIATIFSKHLFWNMDHSKISISRDKDIIIPRSLFATNQETFPTDIVKLEHYYSKTLILKHLKTTKERISNEVCAMVAKRYNVPTFTRFKRE
jgi:hypothetical protein